jgi:hypothetical protein
MHHFLRVVALIFLGFSTDDATDSDVVVPPARTAVIAT